MKAFLHAQRQRPAWGPEPSATLVPTKSCIITSRGRLPAATASERAKLVTMPVCLSVARAAEAMPSLFLGAPFIAALVFGAQKRPPPSPKRTRPDRDGAVGRRRREHRDEPRARAARLEERGRGSRESRADAVREDAAQRAHDGR